MPYELRYSRESLGDLRRLRQFDRVRILDQVKHLLTVNPTVESKSHIKKLRTPAPTEYRLRVGEFRVFYDVEGDHVNIIRVLSKEQAIGYLVSE